VQHARKRLNENKFSRVLDIAAMACHRDLDHTMGFPLQRTWSNPQEGRSVVLAE
jgi:hypothetical protein